MSAQTPLHVRIANAAAVFISLFLAGQTAASSYLILPCILQSPAPLLARQWKTLFAREARLSIPGCLTCSVLFGWLASREHAYTHAFKFYSFAAILSPSIVPYTLLVLRPTNAKLEERAMAAAKAADIQESGMVDAQKYRLGRGDGEPAEGETVHGLVDRWGWLNMGRAAISILAGASAVWASVGEA